MKPGTYRLIKALPALYPDKRKTRDWRALPMAEGMLFAVRDESWNDCGLTIRKHSAYGFRSLRLDLPEIAPLLAALELVEETPSMWLEREEHEASACRILDILAEEGKITLADVIAAESADDDPGNTDAPEELAFR